MNEYYNAACEMQDAIWKMERIYRRLTESEKAATAAPVSVVMEVVRLIEADSKPGA